MSENSPRVRALSELRDALAALNSVPAAGLRGEDKHEELLTAVNSVEALERALANEVDQEGES